MKKKKRRNRTIKLTWGSRSSDCSFCANAWEAAITLWTVQTIDSWETWQTNVTLGSFGTDHSWQTWLTDEAGSAREAISSRLALFSRKTVKTYQPDLNGLLNWAHR